MALFGLGSAFGAPLSALGRGSLGGLVGGIGGFGVGGPGIWAGTYRPEQQAALDRAKADWAAQNPSGAPGAQPLSPGPQMPGLPGFGGGGQGPYADLIKSQQIPLEQFPPELRQQFEGGWRLHGMDGQPSPNLFGDYMNQFHRMNPGSGFGGGFGGAGGPVMGGASPWAAQMNPSLWYGGLAQRGGGLTPLSAMARPAAGLARGLFGW